MYQQCDQFLWCTFSAEEIGVGFANDFTAVQSSFPQQESCTREEKVNVGNIYTNGKNGYWHGEEINKNVINPKTNVYQIINNENGEEAN